MLNALESQRPNPRARPPHMTGAGPLLPADRRQQRRDLHGRARRSCGTARTGGRASRSPTRAAPRSSASPAASPGPAASSCPMGAPMRRAHRGPRRRHAARVRAARRQPGRRLHRVRRRGRARRAPRLRHHGRGRRAASAPGTLVLLDDQTCPVGMTLNMMQFFAQESCGWCTPCREGLQWTAALLEDIEYGRGRAGRPRRARRAASGSWQSDKCFCDLAPGATQPLESALRLFPDDFARHIDGGRLPLPAPRLGRAGDAGDDLVSGGGAAAPPKLVTVIIDGAEYQAEEGRNMLDVALSLGFDLPFFCWHPVLGSIGACRQCAVRLLLDRPRGQREERDRHGLHDGGAGGHEDGHLRRGGDPLPRRDDRAHDAQPPARLPGLRRGRRVPPAGHDGDDRAQLPALPRPQADVREPGPGTVRHPRAQPLHHLLPLRALLQRLRRRPRLRRVRPAQPGVLRARRERHARERVQRQPHRGVPHRRVRRQAVLAPVRAQVGPADGAVGVPGLRPRLHDDALGALRRAAPRAGPVQPRRQQDVPLRPRPLRLRVRQRAGARARGAGRGRPAAAAGGGGRGGCAGRGRRGGRGRGRAAAHRRAADRGGRPRARGGAVGRRSGADGRPGRRRGRRPAG